MATEHRILRRIERELSRDRVLVRVAGLFPGPLPCRQPVRSGGGRWRLRRPVVRLGVLAIVLAVVGLACGITGALVGIAWLTAASFVVVSAAGALMAWRGATAIQPAVASAPNP